MVIVMILIPFSGFVAFGLDVGSKWEKMLSFQYEGNYDPDTEFIPGNYSRMSEMAEVYDDLYQQHHLPLNYCTNVIYTDENATEVAYYDFTDNGALWTGIGMAAWVFHYLTAKEEGNQAEIQYCLEVIQRMIHGFSMMMKVPNGGLGPEFSGILARGWAGPQHKDIAPMFFSENIRHFNGTGKYSQWRWRGFTSNDEYGGFYMGLALALKYVDNDWVQDTSGKIVLQLANYMLETNFLGISGPGGPSGVNQKPTFGNGGFWIPLLLKMASMVKPEKYTQHYNHWVSAELCFLSNSEGHDGETVANYYAYNFGHCVVLAFLLLEGTESEIGQRYYEGYLNSLRKFTSNHRNAWFNAIFLMISDADDGEYDIIQRDIEDQLMRLDINHFPDRRYGIVPVDPSEEVVTDIQEVNKSIHEDNWDGLYSMPFIEMDFDETYFVRAQTVEHHKTGNFMWEDNPFENETSGYYPRKEYPGTTFTVPYWMMRYMGLIPAQGIREVL